MEKLPQEDIPEINNTQMSEDDEETRHFFQIVHAFKCYRTHSLKRLVSTEKSFRSIPEHQQALVSNFQDNICKIRTCIDHNYEIIKLILRYTDHMFENTNHPSSTNKEAMKPASEFDMDKLKSTLRQIVRDWSAAGKVERDACYQPVIDRILKYFPSSHCVAGDVNVLVPGAGLGRLAFEIACHGYSCQGNEFSLFMLFVSNFVLNTCKEMNLYTLYPWVHQYCNVMSTEDQTRPITFPDISPTMVPENTAFSMAAGDFLEVYIDPDCWDCVATVFFLDTAHNIIQYIETIYKILKPGGIWINMGPLLYHFADMPNELSVELPYDDVRHVMLKMNFEILEEQVDVPCTYTQNPRSMLRNEYKCVFFVLRKPVHSF